MSSVFVRATVLLSVDISAVRAQTEDEFEDTTDEDVALQWVEGEEGAPIDNHILIETVESVQLARPSA